MYGSISKSLPNNPTDVLDNNGNDEEISTNKLLDDKNEGGTLGFSGQDKLSKFGLRNNEEFSIATSPTRKRDLI